MLCTRTYSYNAHVLTYLDFGDDLHILIEQTIGYWLNRYIFFVRNFFDKCRYGKFIFVIEWSDYS